MICTLVHPFINFPPPLFHPPFSPIDNWNDAIKYVNSLEKVYLEMLKKNSNVIDKYASTVFAKNENDTVIFKYAVYYHYHEDNKWIEGSQRFTVTKTEVPAQIIEMLEKSPPHDEVDVGDFFELEEGEGV